MNSKPLKSPQRERFAREIALGRSQAQAYRTAYPSSSKWPEKSVWARASHLASDNKVIARVAALTAPALKKHEVTLDRLIEENAKIAFSDVREMFNDDGTLKPISEWPAFLAGSVASIEVTGGESSITKIKFWDKGAALDRLMKHYGLYAREYAQKVVAIEEMLAEIARVGRGIHSRRSSELICEKNDLDEVI